jgi:hypothetical protein
LNCRTTFAAAGQTWAPWVPIQSLNRTDADVTIFFLSFNNVEFVGANDDPIFSAHITSTSTLGVPVKKPDRNVSALACAEQHQFCNPNIAQGAPNRCTKLTASERVWENNDVEDIQLLLETDVKRLHNTSLDLNPFQEVIAGYSSSAISGGMYFSVFGRGVAALKGEFTPSMSIHFHDPVDAFSSPMQPPKPSTSMSKAPFPTTNGLSSFPTGSPWVSPECSKAHWSMPSALNISGRRASWNGQQRMIHWLSDSADRN